MKGITQSTLDRLRLIRENLENVVLNLQRPSDLAWFCEQIREVVYDLHEELLKQGGQLPLPIGRGLQVNHDGSSRSPHSSPR